MSWLDQAFGISPQAMMVRSQRSSELAANIANSETPDYKARDYDFKSALQGALESRGSNMKSTHASHFNVGDSSPAGAKLYRIPTKEMFEGNSVEAEIEQAAFSENALRYQTSLQFLNGTISGLRLAIKGD